MSAGGDGPTERGANIRVAGPAKRFRSGDGLIIGADHRISRAVQAGATVTVTGPSGSKKSTSLHLIGCDRADR